MGTPFPYELAASLALSAALWGCTSSPALPPALGDCVPVDGGTCVAEQTDGGGRIVGTVVPPGEGGSSAPQCAVQSSDALCVQCANARCCGPLNGCDMTCVNLEMCETRPSCSGGAACVKQCEMIDTGGVVAYGALTSCLTLNCPVCSELGAGDPCAPQGTACNAGLTCSGGWCTKACERAPDCVGLGPGGASTAGLENACIATTSGSSCVPGCVTDADCVAFPGTYCLATTSADRLSVQVCAPSP